MRYRIYLGKMLAGQTSPGYGNAVPMEDRLGTVTAGYPYGTAISAVPYYNWLNAPDFATYIKDGSTGLEYANQRYYSAGCGRFLSVDPYRGGARADEPGSWNAFSYVAGNPINDKDSSGLLAESCDAMAGDFEESFEPCPSDEGDPFGFNDGGLGGTCVYVGNLEPDYCYKIDPKQLDPNDFVQVAARHSPV